MLQSDYNPILDEKALMSIGGIGNSMLFADQHGIDFILDSPVISCLVGPGEQGENNKPVIH